MAAQRSEAAAQSKDPGPLCSEMNLNRRSHRLFRSVRVAGDGVVVRDYELRADSFWLKLHVLDSGSVDQRLLISYALPFSVLPHPRIRKTSMMDKGLAIICAFGSISAGDNGDISIEVHAGF